MKEKYSHDYGKKIFDKIMDKMQPEFPVLEEPVNPFDFWAGADFQLKIRNVAGYRNYDKSEFKEPSALFFEADEANSKQLYNSLHEVTEFTDPKTYKSYDELKSRLEVVLGQATGGGSTVKNESLNKTAEAVSPREAEPKVVPSAPEPEITSKDDDDDIFSYFAKLANEE